MMRVRRCRCQARIQRGFVVGRRFAWAVFFPPERFAVVPLFFLEDEADPDFFFVDADLLFDVSPPDETRDECFVR